MNEGTQLAEIGGRKTDLHAYEAVSRDSERQCGTESCEVEGCICWKYIRSQTG